MHLLSLTAVVRQASLLAIALWLGGAAGAAGAPPPMRLDPAVQPLAYRLHLVVDPDQPRHSGEVEIALQLQTGLPAGTPLLLHAKDLVIRSVVIDQGPRRLVGQARQLDAERIALRFKQALDPGPARLQLGFAGTVSDTDVYGLFRQQEGDRWLAYTQFQTAGARLAFPLFDEPGFKVPWTLSLTVPKALTAVANMPVAGEASAGPRHKRVDFETTPPLPSYLLAFAVGRFDLLEGGSLPRGGEAGRLPLRFITPAGRSAEAAYAAGVTGRIVERLETWFGMPYPYAKLDSLAIPLTSQFSAMEHVGLITYASTLLLASPAEQTPNFERSYVSVAAHELAHQWFGNLVTLAWWDDLWLNESFASWLGDKVTAEVQPGWGWQTSLQQARKRAMRADRLVSARRIEQPVRSDDDLGNLFDAITYEKGQAVLAMFEAWLGPEAFQAGVRRYIRRHAGGLATSDDFFAALSAEGEALAPAIRSFTRQSGIPRLALTLRCDGGPPRLQLAQSRLLPLGSDGADLAQRWQLPLVLRTPAGVQRLMLREAQATLDLADTQCPAWVLANAGGAGYYRVAYGGDLLERLLAAPDLSTGEWLVLLDDARGLHDAGDIDSRQALDLVRAGARHREREVVQAAADLLRHLRPLLAPAQREAYARQWQSAFGARAHALGWQPRAGESDDDRLLRAELLPLVADLGEDGALRDQALQLARRWLADRNSLAAELRAPVLATAALADVAGGEGGGQSLFDGLAAALQRSTLRTERGDLLGALGHFRQPAIAERARSLLLDAGIDLRDSLWPLLGAQAAEPATRAGALDFVIRHHAALARRLGRDEPAHLPSLFNHGCSADEGQRIDAGFGRQASRYPGGRQALARTLEAVRLCSAWRATQPSGF